MTSGVLVIGVGNAWRGDDAAGLAVAQAFRETDRAEIRTLEATGEPTALIEAFDGGDAVFVVDAANTAATPGTVTFLNVEDILAGRVADDPSSHGLGVGQAVHLAAALDKLPRSLAVVTIEGETFNHGAALSPCAEKGVRDAIRGIQKRIDALFKSGGEDA